MYKGTDSYNGFIWETRWLYVVGVLQKVVVVCSDVLWWVYSVAAAGRGGCGGGELYVLFCLRLRLTI